MSMSPPDAPTPPAPFGWPRYSSEQPEAPLPPTDDRPRQRSLPLPTPRSEPRNTSLARETWIDGSPSVFVPHPLAPTVVACSWPNEKLFALLLGVGAAATLGAIASASSAVTMPTRLPVRWSISASGRVRLPAGTHPRPEAGAYS